LKTHPSFSPLLKQFWRLITSHFAFSSSTEFLFGALIIYHLRVIERLFGPSKYAVLLGVSFRNPTMPMYLHSLYVN